MIRSLLLAFTPAWLCVCIGCTSTQPNLAQTVAEQAALTDTSAAIVTTWMVDSTRFTRTCADTLYPRVYQGPGRTRPLQKLTESERAHYLQGEAPSYANADLYFGAILHSPPAEWCITVLADRDDDHDLLWLRYDREGRLNGLDTLASIYGDGQLTVTEYAYCGAYGRLLVAHVQEETLRDERDTMAYLIDTVLFEPDIVIVEAEPAERYALQRTGVDLTRHWVEHTAYSAPGYKRSRSLMQLVPPDRSVFQMAVGDLNNDQVNDYALVLQGDPDGERDLQVVFTVRASTGFRQQTLVPGLLPSRDSGGFHDPIGEPGISGVSIEEGKLVITQFGGSAWKWTSRSEYTYVPDRDRFYLTSEGGRSFHAASEGSLEEQVHFLQEEQRTHGPLSATQQQELNELLEQQRKATWTEVHFPIGERPLKKP